MEHWSCRNRPTASAMDVYNKLENAYLNNHPNMKVMQRKTLEQLIDYANYHFTMEEKLMMENYYPEAANHWRMHKDFRFALNEQLRSLREEGSILCSYLLMLMRNWLERHILVEDLKFVIFVKSL